MKHIKLNKNWNAESNAPNPVITKTDDGIEMNFLLNSSTYSHIDEGDEGILKFEDVYAYRIAAMNKEGYLAGQFRFNNNNLPWGEFYELKNSEWANDFPNDKIIIDESVNKKKLRHFIFFLKEEIFECLALDYQFKFIDKISDELEIKYPKGYFNHYLTMFASQFDKPSLENFHMYIDLYLQMESKKEFLGLKEELKSIKSNHDIDSYLKVINYFEMEKFGKAQLLEMIKTIENFKIDK